MNHQLPIRSGLSHRLTFTAKYAKPPLYSKPDNVVSRHHFQEADHVRLSVHFTVLERPSAVTDPALCPRIP